MELSLFDGRRHGHDHYELFSHGTLAYLCCPIPTIPAPATLQWSSRDQPPCLASDLPASEWYRCGLEGEPLESLWRLASSVPTPCSSDPPPLHLPSLWLTVSGFQQPTSCCHMASFRCTDLVCSLLTLTGHRSRPSLYWVPSLQPEAHWRATENN